jgi:hypothetical protein
MLILIGVGAAVERRPLRLVFEEAHCFDVLDMFASALILLFLGS